MAQITKSTIPPVTLDEFKNHLHMFTNDFDSNLELDLRAAIAKAEGFINAAIWQVSQQVSVPFVKKVNVAGYNAVVSNVKVDGQEVAYTYIEGIIEVESTQGKVLTYDVTKGYTNADCPDAIKMAILLIASKFFNSPVDSVENLPSASQSLLHPYKNYNL